MIWARVSQYGFPFSWPGAPLGKPTMRRLRQMGHSSLFVTRPPLERSLAKAAMVLFWPLGAALTTIRVGRDKNAPPGRRLGAYWYALRHNVPPLEYYLHRLWEPARRARLDDYLYWTENGRALVALNRAAGWRQGPCPVSDKLLFSELCTRERVSTPAIFLAPCNGETVEASALPRQDLLLKPVLAKSGIGIELWQWRDGSYHREDAVLTAAEMARHIAAHAARHKRILVQEVVRGHPSLGLAAPVCARIITGRRRDGRVEIVDAMAIWPRAGSAVTQGGEVAMIDTASGRLGPVFPEGPIETDLGGRDLPDWRQALEMVQAAHAALPTYVFLGWDVAFGDAGPVLLETNSGWGAFHHQLIPDRPIGDTRFADIAADYI